MIYHASDGAILTTLNRGDMVFTNEQAQKLWELSKSPDLLWNASNVPLTMPDPMPVNNQNMGDVNVNFGDIILPDVTNDREFAGKVINTFTDVMCNNSRVRRCVTEAVCSETMGKGAGKARMWSR